MNLDQYLGKPVKDVFDKLKGSDSSITLSKSDDVFFITSKKMGFYLDTEEGSESVCSYRIYLIPDEEFPNVNTDILGVFSGITTVADIEKIYGSPIREIPSLNIPGMPKIPGGKEYKYTNHCVLKTAEIDENIAYIHIVKHS